MHFKFFKGCLPRILDRNFRDFFSIIRHLVFLIDTVRKKSWKKSFECRKVGEKSGNLLNNFSWEPYFSWYKLDLKIFHARIELLGPHEKMVFFVILVSPLKNEVF